MPHWITANGVIATFTLVIALATIVYVIFTVLLWRETKKSADAAATSARAATLSANAAQENLQLFKEEYEDRIGRGPQILHQALLNARALIAFWHPYVPMGVANPHAVPDPTPLATPDLIHTVEHARRISPDLAALVSNVISNLQFAKSEFDKIKQSYRGPSMAPAGLHGNNPSVYLAKADEAITAALKYLETKGTP